MLYLSKGAVLAKSDEEMFRVTLYGVDYMLTGIGAQLWLGGRFGVSEPKGTRELLHLHKLHELGLVELSQETGLLAAYHLLTRCIICPAIRQPLCIPLTEVERKVWIWLSKAGIRLTIGELTKLFEEKLEPIPSLLGKKNAQALTMKLYAKDLIFDTTLDIRMEGSLKRDEVSTAVLGLLRKKSILLT